MLRPVTVRYFCRFHVLYAPPFFCFHTTKLHHHHDSKSSSEIEAGCSSHCNLSFSFQNRHCKFVHCRRHVIPYLNLGGNVRIREHIFSAMGVGRWGGRNHHLVLVQDLRPADFKRSLYMKLCNYNLLQQIVVETPYETEFFQISSNIQLHILWNRI